MNQEQSINKIKWLHAWGYIFHFGVKGSVGRSGVFKYRTRCKIVVRFHMCGNEHESIVCDFSSSQIKPNSQPITTTPTYITHRTQNTKHKTQNTKHKTQLHVRNVVNEGDLE